MSVIIEYVWIDRYQGTRSKIKVMSSDKVDLQLSDIPDWNFDGSSTSQASVAKSELILKPVALYNNPFGVNTRTSYLVLCDIWINNTEQHGGNTRKLALDKLDSVKEADPMFGFEQEFFFAKDGIPVSFIGKKEMRSQGDYYCGLGSYCIVGRAIIEKTLDRSLTAGIKLTGANAEVAPSQWEFQVCSTGIKAADDLWMLRYILGRTTEELNCDVTYHPKPVGGEWNGSGLHTNFSTTKTRDVDGLTELNRIVDNLKKTHKEDIETYGDEENKKRLTGECETANYDECTSGIGDRTKSIRISNEVNDNKCGYLEDRRPAANADPYCIITTLCKAI
jgi:glutamine synthetase